MTFKQPFHFVTSHILFYVLHKYQLSGWSQAVYSLIFDSNDEERTEKKKDEKNKTQNVAENKRATKLVRRKSTVLLYSIFNMWNVAYIVRCHYWTSGHKLLSYCLVAIVVQEDEEEKKNESKLTNDLLD